MISKESLNLQLDLIDKLKAKATSAPKLSSKFRKSNFASLKTAFLIRAVEMALLDLFAQANAGRNLGSFVVKSALTIIFLSAGLYYLITSWPF